jgi:hypothetical protein
MVVFRRGRALWDERRGLTGPANGIAAFFKEKD